MESTCRRTVLGDHSGTNAVGCNRCNEAKPTEEHPLKCLKTLGDEIAGSVKRLHSLGDELRDVQTELKKAKAELQVFAAKHGIRLG